jgi:hypothetical protein
MKPQQSGSTTASAARPFATTEHMQLYSLLIWSELCWDPLAWASSSAAPAQGRCPTFSANRWLMMADCMLLLLLLLLLVPVLVVTTPILVPIWLSCRICYLLPNTEFFSSSHADARLAVDIIVWFSSCLPLLSH